MIQELITIWLVIGAIITIGMFLGDGLSTEFPVLTGAAVWLCWPLIIVFGLGVMVWMVLRQLWIELSLLMTKFIKKDN